MSTTASFEIFVIIFVFIFWGSIFYLFTLVVKALKNI